MVSGGHTNLYVVSNYNNVTLVGRTRDDAAGEAFDKVAKFLDLGYSGGVVIDELARSGNPSAISFPRAYLEKDSLDFSFSGIKTAVVNFVRKYVDSNQSGSIGISANSSGVAKQLPVQVADIAASFQEAVVDVLVVKTCAAAQCFDASQVVVAGGVAANSRLRERLREEVARLGLPLMLPRAELWLLPLVFTSLKKPAAAGIWILTPFPAGRISQRAASSRQQAAGRLIHVLGLILLKDTEVPCITEMQFLYLLRHPRSELAMKVVPREQLEYF